MSDRRDFLRTVAQGAAYAAPAIYTLSTPRRLMAIVVSGKGMMGGWGMVQGAAQDQPGPDAPWSAPAGMAPWEESPPWGGSGSGGSGGGPGGDE